MICPFCNKDIEMSNEFFICKDQTKERYHYFQFKDESHVMFISFLSQNKTKQYEFEYHPEVKTVDIFIFSEDKDSIFLVDLDFGEINSLSSLYNKAKSYIKNIAFV